MKLPNFTCLNKHICCVLFIIINPVSASAQMSRAAREFAKKGIETQAWMGVDASPGLPGTSNPININRAGRYIRVQIPFTQYLSVAELQVFSNGVNVALGKTATQSSDFIGTASRAVDGNTSGAWSDNSTTHTDMNQEAWLQVDLGQSYQISQIVIWNRTDCCGDRLRGFYLFVSDNAFVNNTLNGAYTQSGVSHYYKGGPTVYAINSEWSNTNMTSPTFYDEPAFNSTFLQQHPTNTWAMAKAPYAQALTSRHTGDPGPFLQRSPNSEELSKGYLNSMQQSALSRLTTVCFGDEENYSTSIVNWLKDWYELSHTKYPDVLVHNNQYSGQWSESNLRTYLQTAKPDLLTYDAYYFWRTNTSSSPGGSLSTVFNNLHTYRKLALEGIDGSGASPIGFGLYLGGYRTANSGATNGNQTDVGYTISESQIFGVANAGLVMGAKWLNIFRYEPDPYAFFFRDGNGGFQPQYWQYAALFKEIKNLSPHLSRLTSTDVRVIQGLNPSGTNAKPSNMSVWDNGAGPYITGIAATNLVGGTNNGLRGDVIVGYFKPVPGLNSTAGVTMGPVPDINQRYFMLMNGLTKPNGCCSAFGSPGIQQDTIQGKAVFARQAITLTINFGGNPVDTLYKVRKDNGQVMMVTLTPGSGGNYTFIDTLDGGKADLFYWKNAHKIPSAIVKLYGDCNYGWWSVNINAPGNYTQGQLEALGFLNDGVSSLKVQPGYQVTLYSDNNFMGSSLVVTGDNSCLVSNSFNDLTSSLKITATGSFMAKTASAETYIKNGKSEDGIFPNPLTGEMLNVLIDLPKEGKVTFSLFDNAGKAIRTTEKILPKGSNRTSFYTGKIPAGIYILKINGPGKLVDYKLVKQ